MSRARERDLARRADYLRRDREAEVAHLAKVEERQRLARESAYEQARKEVAANGKADREKRKAANEKRRADRKANGWGRKGGRP